MKPTQDARAALARLIAESKKSARDMKRALRQAGIDPDRRVDLADIRASIRKARMDAEVDKRVAAQAGSGRLLRMDEVRKLTGLGRTTLWQLERSGRFPKGVRPLGTRAVRWHESEVRAWMATRTSARTA